MKRLDEVRCIPCKSVFDIETLNELGYNFCPKCGGKLSPVYERKPPPLKRDLVSILYAMAKQE